MCIRDRSGTGAVMRMMPHSLLALKNPRGTPLRAKGRPAAKVTHFSAPLKGLSRFAELNETDPMLVSTLIPYYGQPSKLAAASGDKIYSLAGVQIGTGFGGDDWAWTSFSNLSS